MTQYYNAKRMLKYNTLVQEQLQEQQHSHGSQHFTLMGSQWLETYRMGWKARKSEKNEKLSKHIYIFAIN